MKRLPDPSEWLETDGQGGFASGTAGTIRTRRYHALLLTATTPPSGRVVLVNGIEACIDIGGATVPLSSQRYRDGTIYPAGIDAISAFSANPIPAWTYALPGGRELTAEIFIAPGSGQTSLIWRLAGGSGPATLHVRPLMSGRDYHGLHHQNPAFRFDPVSGACERIVWQPYPGLPPIAVHGGSYTHDPVWYGNFLYTEEAERGLDSLEDLASPGILSWDLSAGPATLALRADTSLPFPVVELAASERARRSAMAPLRRAARHFVAARSGGSTLIAGFPWFTDWGRDTFIAMRGLLLATGEHDMARSVLLAWSGLVTEGMLPNRFPDGDGAPEYNSVDASLWFIVAVHDLFAASPVPTLDAEKLRAACLAIVEGYAAGTRYGIRMDADGLIACGVPGVQLTWMDAKVGDWVVTPRIGKPVEVQALWINALAIVGGWPGHEQPWRAHESQARQSFIERFPDPATGGLRDVIDPEDATIRPNQILAAGGLPLTCVPQALARSLLSLVEDRLLTPLGLRTLDPADPAYIGRYEGGVTSRDGAYHQGTAWPWLLGPFTEAWLRAGGAREEARSRFLQPLREHLHVAGLDSVSEIADGDAPHTPRGCPFQAWSVGEMLRIESMVSEMR